MGIRDRYRIVFNEEDDRDYKKSENKCQEMGDDPSIMIGTPSTSHFESKQNAKLVDEKSETILGFDSRSKFMIIGGENCWWMTGGFIDMICALLGTDHEEYMEKSITCDMVAKIFSTIRYESIEEVFKHDRLRNNRAKFIKLVSFRMFADSCYDLYKCLAYIGDPCKFNKFVSIELIKEVRYFINTKQFSRSEFKLVYNEIVERLKHAYVFKFKDNFLDAFNQIDSNKFSPYYFTRVCDTLEDLSNQFLAVNRKYSSFLQSPNADSVDISSSMFAKIRNINERNIIHTGMMRLNAALHPGFIPGRVYVFTGSTGDGKSKLLLNLAVQASKFNKQFNDSHTDYDRIPTALYISLENDNNMTLSRLSSLLSSNLNHDQRMLYNSIENPAEQNKFLLDTVGISGEKSGMNLHVRYLPAASSNVNNVYSIIEELLGLGYQPMIVFIDYLKLLRSNASYTNIKDQLNHTTLELEQLSKVHDIPVVTAHQTNRATYAAANERRLKNRSISDAYSLASVGNAWDISENVDFVCNIFTVKAEYPEQYYLGFKVEKESRDRLRTFDTVPYVKEWYQPFFKPSAIGLQTDMPADIDLHTLYKFNYTLVSLIDDSWNLRLTAREIGPNEFTNEYEYQNVPVEVMVKDKPKEEPKIVS